MSGATAPTSFTTTITRRATTPAERSRPHRSTSPATVERRVASERPIRAHCCARCPEAGSNHRRDESTPIGSFNTASLSRLSGETSWSGCVYPAALRSPSTTHLGLRFAAYGAPAGVAWNPYRASYGGKMAAAVRVSDTWYQTCLRFNHCAGARVPAPRQNSYPCWPPQPRVGGTSRTVTPRAGIEGEYLAAVA
jgi:hypothetical protein